MLLGQSVFRQTRHIHTPASSKAPFRCTPSRRRSTRSRSSPFRRIARRGPPGLRRASDRPVGRFQPATGSQEAGHLQRRRKPRACVKQNEQRIAGTEVIAADCQFSSCFSEHATSARHACLFPTSFERHALSYLVVLPGVEGGLDLNSHVYLNLEYGI